MIELLINGTKVLPSPKQAKAVMELLFNTKEESQESETVKTMKEERKGKKKYNAVLGLRKYTPEDDKRLVERYIELKKTTPVQSGKQIILPILAKEFNRSVGAISVRMTVLENQYPELSKYKRRYNSHNQ